MIECIRHTFVCQLQSRLELALIATYLCLPHPCLLLLGAAVNDGGLEFQLDLTSAGASLLEVLDHFQALVIGNLPEDDMFAVQPRGDNGRDEELGTVSVWSRIGHGQQTRSCVLFLEVFVREFLAVDRLATSTIASSEVATLQHELRDDSVELATLVAKALLASAKSTEVLGSLWDYIIVEVEVDSSSLGRRDAAAGTLCIGSGFVKSSVGVFDVEPGFDGHVCGRRREVSSGPRSSGWKSVRKQRLTDETSWRGEGVE